MVGAGGVVELGVAQAAGSHPVLQLHAQVRLRAQFVVHGLQDDLCEQETG